MTFDDRIRRAVQARAATFDVEDRPWSDVRKAERYRQRRLHRQLVVAVAATCAVGFVAWTMSIILWHEQRPLDLATPMSSVRQVPTGELETVAAGETQAGAWELVALHTSHGPCVGVQATDPVRRASRTPRGWPRAAVQCTPDIELAGDAVFIVGLRTGSSELEPFVVVVTARGDSPVRVRIDSGAGSEVRSAVPARFGERLAALAVPLPRDARVVDAAREGESGPFARATVTVPGDSPAVVVGTSEDRIVTAFYDARGGICTVVRRRGDVGSDPPPCPSGAGSSWPPPRGGRGTYEVDGVAPPGTRRVALLDHDRRVVTVTTTFGCDAGFPACFYFAEVDRPIIAANFEFE